MTATATPAMTTAAMAAVRPIELVRTPAFLSGFSLRPRGLLTHGFGDASAPRRGCQRGTVAENGPQIPTASFGALQRFPLDAALGSRQGEMRTGYHQDSA